MSNTKLETKISKFVNLIIIIIYEARLFVFVYHFEISQITMPLATLLVWLEIPLMTRGGPSWFHNVLTYFGEAIIEY
jgi:hypothetical protein